MRFFKRLCIALIALGTFPSVPVVNAKPIGKPNISSAFLIVPGVRVGPVRLGMTRRQVKAVLGAPSYVYYGHKSYGGPARESYKNYHLAFSDAGASGRVIIIEIKSPQFKTADGLSTNSQFKSIKQRHKHMTVVREDPFEIWTFSYNNQPKGIGFCFECPRNFEDSAKDRNIRPKENQRPVTIGIYPRGKNWKAFYSSE